MQENKTLFQHDYQTSTLTENWFTFIFLGIETRNMENKHTQLNCFVYILAYLHMTINYIGYLYMLWVWDHFHWNCNDHIMADGQAVSSRLISPFFLAFFCFLYIVLYVESTLNEWNKAQAFCWIQRKIWAICQTTKLLY